MDAKYNALARLQVVAELRVTPKQIEQDIGNKGIGYVMMPCLDFLKLTTTRAFFDDLMSDKIEPFSKRETKERTLMPWLDIMPDGKIVGHEGRHRAAGLLKEGVEQLPVAIHLKDEKGYGEYHKWWFDEEKHERGSRYLDVTDIPPYWTNQFGTGFAFPFSRVKKTFKWHYEGWGKP